MTRECKDDGSELETRVCVAAHKLHETHFNWARTAMSRDPTDCYQCHVFARIVLVEDAKL